MPLVDKPLAELRTYSGRNPCPTDIDPYWDAALAEMAIMDSQIELRPAAFQAPFAECFDLFFTGVGGSRVRAKYLRPKNPAGKHPALLQFHGYGGHSGDWQDKLSWVNGLGCAVASMDCRGQMGSRSQDLASVEGSTFKGHIVRGLDDPDPCKLAFRQIYLDTAQLARIVAGLPEVDAGRLGAMGGSQGGGLTLACAALAPELIRRAAPVFPFLCDYQRVWEMDLADGPYEELKGYFRHSDPRHEREVEIFTKLGYVDLQHITKRIKGEILMGVGLMDRICPPSTQFAAFNKITAPKNAVIYPDFGHEALPGFQDMVFKFLGGL